VDTVGDGIANATGYDTNGDGHIDALDTTGDGRIDMRKPPPTNNSVLPPAYSLSDSHNTTDPNGYGSNYANSYGGQQNQQSNYSSYNSAPPSSQNMRR
jgi:hypothetical protein